MSPRRDIGRAYLNALDQEPKPKPDPEAAEEPASEPVLLAGEGPRQNGVSYGTRSAMRRLLAEAEEQAKAEAEQRAKPRSRRSPRWWAVLVISVASCAVGFALGRIGREPSPLPEAVPTIVIPPGHYYCGRCQTTHPKPLHAIGNPRTWCPKLSQPDQPQSAATGETHIPDRVRRLRSGTRLP